VFSLVLIGDSLAELSITHEALLRWIVVHIIRVKALEKIVAAAEELAQSPRSLSLEKSAPAQLLLSSSKSTLEDFMVLARSSERDCR
jgi:hypothetical protein